MSLISVFNRGLDGLQIASRGLAVASNNVANANTPGYARQRVNVTSRAETPGDASLGGGAVVTGISSIVSPFIEAQLFQTSNTFGTFDGRRGTINQLESVWEQSQQTGLGNGMNSFFNSFSDLASDPTNIASRQAVQQKGIYLTQQFNLMSQQFNGMRANLSDEISTRVRTVNALASNIASLNQAISVGGGAEQSPGLSAQRTDALRQLSEEVNVTYFQTADGNIQVQTAGGESLVLGFNSGSLSFSDNLGAGGRSTISLTTPRGAGSIDITSGITGGRLGGNLIDRNITLNTQVANIDQLAYQVVTQFNQLHSTGYGLNSATGNNFFAPLGSATGAAAAMSMDASVLNDVKNIAAAQQDPAVSGVGDNRIATQLAGLQNSLTMSSNSKTFAQYYQGLVGDIGVTSQSIQNSWKNQTDLLNQAKIQREAVSGVNMDEEGSDIIRFQKAFQASSKLIIVAGEMLDELLKI